MTEHTERACPRLREASGFTLIEILVVILIIGILAAIAVPSFLNQRTKGQDACAKALVRAAVTAMSVYQMDHNSYSGAEPAELYSKENQVTDGKCGPTSVVTTGASSGGDGSCVGNAPASDNYCIQVTSAAGDRPFKWDYDNSGKVIRLCGARAGGAGSAANGGGCRDGEW